MERDSLHSATNFQTFWRSLPPPSSGMVNVPNCMAVCLRRHVRISFLTWTWVSSQAQKCCFWCLMLFIPFSGEFVYNGCHYHSTCLFKNKNLLFHFKPVILLTVNLITQVYIMSVRATWCLHATLLLHLHICNNAFMCFQGPTEYLCS